MDRASLLEFEPHAPVLHFLDAASFECVTVLEDESPKDGLQRVVEVHGQKELHGAQLFVALCRQNTFVKRELPLGWGQGEKQFREPPCLPAHVF